MSFISDILTIGTAVKVGAGVVGHKVYQVIAEKFKTAEADVKKAASDLKKDL